MISIWTTAAISVLGGIAYVAVMSAYHYKKEAYRMRDLGAGHALELFLTKTQLRELYDEMIPSYDGLAAILSENYAAGYEAAMTNARDALGKFIRDESERRDQARTAVSDYSA